eukprot:Gb_20296 [translate_table: standard]
MGSVCGKPFKPILKEHVCVGGSDVVSENLVV